MYNFKKLVASFLTDAATTYAEQLDRLDLLHGADRVYLSEPECNDAGGFWFFISGHVQGQPISIPQVVTGVSRVIDAHRLADTYRLSIIYEMHRRGFPVVLPAAVGSDRNPI